jgi:hypothetical protein
MLAAAHRHGLVREVPALDFRQFRPPAVPVVATALAQGELF